MMVRIVVSIARGHCFSWCRVCKLSGFLISCCDLSVPMWPPNVTSSTGVRRKVEHLGSSWLGCGERVPGLLGWYPDNAWERERERKKHTHTHIYIYIYYICISVPRESQVQMIMGYILLIMPVFEFPNFPHDPRFETEAWWAICMLTGVGYMKG